MSKSSFALHPFIKFMTVPVLVLIGLSLVAFVCWSSSHEYELATASGYEKLEKFAEKHPEFREDIKNFVRQGNNNLANYEIDYFLDILKDRAKREKELPRIEEVKDKIYKLT